MNLYVLEIDNQKSKKYKALGKIDHSSMEIFSFIDITDHINEGKITLSYPNVKLPILEDGNPNEGITEPSRFYFSNPIRVSKRPHHDRNRILGKYAIEYATGKKRNIKKLFGVDLEFNSIAILPKESLMNPEYEDWRINLRCANLTGDLKILKERGVRKFSKNDLI
ncbi:MAG: hypothetical protein J7K87_04445 [Candidatus Aenigmarchaeota archaeon]|nr:hypothetical protein [Candidatus Aenigmarchaeota archaeon]